MLPLLTIGIPTFNRARYLCDALDSIVKQAGENPKDSFEIVVSDNDSRDETSEIIGNYTGKYSFIYYHRNSENIGDDRNGMNIINEAKGKYIWLLGDDDVIEPQGIKKVLKVLNEHDNLKLILTNWKDVDYDLTVLNPKVHGFREDIILSDPNKAFAETKLMYGFMSCVIVERAGLLSIPDTEKYIGTHLILMYLIPKMMLLGSTFIIADPLIAFRHNNQKTWDKKDSQLNAFIHSQILLPSIIMDATRTGFNKQIISTVMKAGYFKNLLNDIIALKLGNRQGSLKIIYKAAKQNVGRLEFWFLFPLLLTPAFFYRAVRRIKRISRTKPFTITDKSKYT